MIQRELIRIDPDKDRVKRYVGRRDQLALEALEDLYKQNYNLIDEPTYDQVKKLEAVKPEFEAGLSIIDLLIKVGVTRISFMIDRDDWDSSDQEKMIARSLCRVIKINPKTHPAINTRLFVELPRGQDTAWSEWRETFLEAWPGVSMGCNPPKAWWPYEAQRYLPPDPPRTWEANMQQAPAQPYPGCNCSQCQRSRGSTIELGWLPKERVADFEWDDSRFYNYVLGASFKEKKDEDA